MGARKQERMKSKIVIYSIAIGLTGCSHSPASDVRSDPVLDLVASVSLVTYRDCLKKHAVPTNDVSSISGTLLVDFALESLPMNIDSWRMLKQTGKPRYKNAIDACNGSPADRERFAKQFGEAKISRMHFDFTNPKELEVKSSEETRKYIFTFRDDLKGK